MEFAHNIIRYTAVTKPRTQAMEIKYSDNKSAA